MTPSLTALANAFCCSALVLGLPSLAGILCAAAYSWHNRISAGGNSFDGLKNPDAILIMLKGMVSITESMAKFLNLIGGYLITGIAILSALGLIFAVGFWFTGRGLHLHQSWARASAFALVIVMPLPALLGMLATRGLFFLVAATLAAACACALHTLVRGFPA